MKKKFQEQIEILNKSNELDIGTLADVYGVSKALIKKFKPDSLKDIDALNPQPDDINLPAIRHTRNGLKRILKGIITEYELENEEFLKIIKNPAILKKNLMQKEESFWQNIHPQVKGLSKKKFEDGHYADSVETALKEINDIVKKYVKKKNGNEYDGAELMQKAFSVKNPIISLDDLSTETGRNVQQGYMQIFSGAMTGIRNPKTHENIKITSERAIQLLFFCSLLFYKLEDGTVI